MDYFDNNNNNIIVKSKYDVEYYYYYCLICSTLIFFMLWLLTFAYVFIGAIDNEKRIFIYIFDNLRIPVSLILFLISSIFSVIYCKLLNYEKNNNSKKEDSVKNIMDELNKSETVVNSQDEIEL